jgi:hypothetical protein
MSTDSDSDKRETMQALSLAKECYSMKLDLLSLATIIERAVKFVDRNRNEDLGRDLILQYVKEEIDDCRI